MAGARGGRTGREKCAPSSLPRPKGWSHVLGRGDKRHPGIPSLPLVVLGILVVLVVLGERGDVTLLLQIEWWWIDLSVHVWFRWLHRRVRKSLVRNLARKLRGIFLGSLHYGILLKSGGF